MCAKKQNKSRRRKKKGTEKEKKQAEKKRRETRESEKERVSSSPRPNAHRDAIMRKNSSDSVLPSLLLSHAVCPLPTPGERRRTATAPTARMPALCTRPTRIPARWGGRVELRRALSRASVGAWERGTWARGGWRLVQTREQKSAPPPPPQALRWDQHPSNCASVCVLWTRRWVVGMAANCHLRRRRNALGNTETMRETSVDLQTATI